MTRSPAPPSPVSRRPTGRARFDRAALEAFDERRRAGRHAVVLTALAFLFLARVTGQALVAFLEVAWLPPMSDWYSGLLPYPVLLPVQILILGFQAQICLDVGRRRGWFAEPRPRAGTILAVLAAVYFLAMTVRYGLTMAWYPERRWFGTGTIPVVFHWVLAASLFTLAHFHRQPRGQHLSRVA